MSVFNRVMASVELGPEERSFPLLVHPAVGFPDVRNIGVTIFNRTNNCVSSAHSNRKNNSLWMSCPNVEGVDGDQKGAQARTLRDPVNKSSAQRGGVTTEAELFDRATSHSSFIFLTEAAAFP